MIVSVAFLLRELTWKKKRGFISFRVLAEIQALIEGLYPTIPSPRSLAASPGHPRGE